MDKVNEYLKRNYKSTVIGDVKLCRIKRMECADGFMISVQQKQCLRMFQLILLIGW